MWLGSCVTVAAVSAGSCSSNSTPSLRTFICRGCGTHSLRYHYLALSEPGPGLPPFLAVGYVDDQLFIRYDSRTGKAEPQAPWTAPLDAQYWEKETEKQRTWAKVQQVEMWTVMGYYNRSSGVLGMHSTQRMFGCEIQEDGRSTGFWQFGFDGQDHLSLDLETLSWVSAEPVAVRTKRWWETERCYAEYDKAYLESVCLTSLHKYLELGGQRAHTPRHSAQDGGNTLRCWALGFYPQDISLSWWLGEKELTSETEYVETRPSGDGTYQTWVAMQVPAGAETQYTCHVQHSSLNHTLVVSWESPSSSGLIAMVISPILVLLGVCAVIKRLQGRERRSKRRTPSGWSSLLGKNAVLPSLQLERFLPGGQQLLPSAPQLHATLRTLRIPQSGETPGPDFGKGQRGRRRGKLGSASAHHSPCLSWFLFVCLFSSNWE
uniref:Ig-like domain-containing protein n=1 Tax=Catagonus wagneri TaxID=51154 RepID=A0A8C3WKQ0_9CETA